MNLYLHFILINSEFNQGLADDLHEGQETEDNIRQLWEDEFMVSEPVETFRIRNNSQYLLEGYYPDGRQFGFEIGDMTVVDCSTKKGGNMKFAVSKKLLKRTEKTVDEAQQETHLYFYLRDTHPMENPMNGVYIIGTDFPKELKPPKKKKNP